MTEREPLLLPAEAERLLGDWPLPVRSEEAWHRSHAAILAKIAANPSEKTPGELLQAPFPANDNEANESPASAPRLVDRAKSANLAPPQAEDDDGHSLLKFARSVAPKKAQDSELSARELLLSASQSRLSSPALPTLPVLPALPPPEQPVHAAPVHSPASSAEAPARGRTAGVLLSLLAAAAAFALWFSSQGTNEPASASVDSRSVGEPSPQAAPQQAASAPASPLTEPDPEQKVAMADGDSPPQQAAFGSGKARRAPEERVALRGPGRSGVGGSSLEKKRAAAVGAIQLEESEASRAAGAPAAQLAATPATPPQASNAPVAAPAKEAATAPASKLTPADSSTGDLPEKPSIGAVQAAVSSKLGAARLCVSGQKGASTASVTFASSGSVQGITVSGPAAGTAAEKCIKSALANARVKPFARANFSVPLTIRPLD